MLTFLVRKGIITKDELNIYSDEIKEIINLYLNN